MARKTICHEEFTGGLPAGIEAFSNLGYLRNGKAKRHYSGEIFSIALPTMICGMEEFDDLERFGKGRKDWLKKHLKLANGVPSDDTFRRVFPASDPKIFLECFITHVANLQPMLPDELIAIEGKISITASPMVIQKTESASSVLGHTPVAYYWVNWLWMGKAMRSLQFR